MTGEESQVFSSRQIFSTDNLPYFLCIWGMNVCTSEVNFQNTNSNIIYHDVARMRSIDFVINCDWIRIECFDKITYMQLRSELGCGRGKMAVHCAAESTSRLNTIPWQVLSDFIFTRRSSFFPQLRRTTMLVRNVLSAVLIGIGTSVIASQLPLNSKFQNYDTGLLNQVDDIRALSTNGFTTLRHPMFPRHSVRIKQNGAESCDNSVKLVLSLGVFTESNWAKSCYRSYTGYIDIEARHLVRYYIPALSTLVHPFLVFHIFWKSEWP